MQPVHIDPEQLYLCARALWRDHLNMIDEIYTLRASMYRLAMAWQGPSAEEFTAELNGVIEQLSDHAEEILSLGLTLSHQGEMWAESDQSWTWKYRNMAR